jgi:sugar lactone lactonase YvrE
MLRILPAVAGRRRYPEVLMKRMQVLPVSAVLAFLAAAAGCGEGAAPADVIDVADAGLMTPESVLADEVADVYLVSNINGGPLERDDNGFISRLTPDGQVESLKWIDGASPDITLHAPKGMAIRGDSLFVADIECIRVFNRLTGASAGNECVEGATFLNDLAVGPEGSIFVTDSGLELDDQGQLVPTGTDGLYRYAFQEGRSGATLATGADLGNPNGVAVGPRGIFVATWSSGEVLRYDAAGIRTVVMPASDRQLDGIVFTSDGGFLFSSWGDSAVYRVGSGGAVSRLIEGVPAPADIGYDARRNRVLIPLFLDNKVLIRPAGG